jgi:hypothetical protein
MTFMITPGKMQSSMPTLVRGMRRSEVVMNGRNRRRSKAKAAWLWIGRRGITINWIMMGTTTPAIVALHRRLTWLRVRRKALSFHPARVPTEFYQRVPAS